MIKSPEEMRDEYESKCTHKRIGHRVLTVDGSAVFDGQKNSQSTGINAAKRYVRKNKLKSFTVKN